MSCQVFFFYPSTKGLPPTACALDNLQTAGAALFFWVRSVGNSKFAAAYHTAVAIPVLVYMCLICLQSDRSRKVA